MTLPSLESWSFWSNIAVVVFTVSAAIAGAFALYFNSKVSALKEAKLKYDIAVVEGNARKDISAARSEADLKIAATNERTASLESDNLKLRADLEKATAETKSKQLELEKEQQKTALAQERAARAQQNLVQFVQRTGDRVLDFAKLVAALKGRPKRDIEIRYAPQPEAKKFGFDLHRAFQEAGWKVSAREIDPAEKISGITIGDVRGTMVISGDSTEVVNPESSFLTELLHSILFGASGMSAFEPSLPHDTVIIVVGPKVDL